MFKSNIQTALGSQRTSAIPSLFPYTPNVKVGQRSSSDNLEDILPLAAEIQVSSYTPASADVSNL